MSNRKLAILAIVAVVMVILTWVQSSMTSRSVGKVKLNAPLIQGLNTRDIAGITLSDGKETTTLQSKGNGFVLTNKDNYPVLMSKVNNLIASCLDIKTAELVTENPDNHAELEVTEESTDLTKPHSKNIVKFLDAKGILITGLVVGKRDYQTGGAYVRLISDKPEVNNRVYQTLNAPWLQNSAMSYIEKKLFLVKKDDIAGVTVTGPKGSYNITSDEAGNIKLKDIPEGKKAKGKDYEQVFSAVTDLEFTDVQRQSEQTKDLHFDGTYVCLLKDSTKCTFELAKKDDKTYLRCRSEFTDELPINRQEIKESDEEKLKEVEAKYIARDASNEFTNKHAGWIYEVASYKADNMTKKLEDLLEDVEQPKKEPVTE